MEEEQQIALEKIQISGPTMASILQSFSSSAGDVNGLLFGHVTRVAPASFSDDVATTTSSEEESPTFIATVTSFLSTNHHSPLHPPRGSGDDSSSSSSLIIGWFSGRRRSALRPSLRESCHVSSLSNSSTSSSSRRCCRIFLLLTTPFQEGLIHTHEYRAYQYHRAGFEPKTLDVVNIGPTFRGHYGSFSANYSPFLPSLSLDNNQRWGSAMAEDDDDSKDRNGGVELEGFDAGRLSTLVGPAATEYTYELEELYKSMLDKLDSLARLVEKTSSKVFEQENHNMKYRFKIAGLE